MKIIRLSIVMNGLLALALLAACGPRQTPALPASEIPPSSTSEIQPGGSILPTETTPAQAASPTAAATEQPSPAPPAGQPRALFALYPLEPVTAQPALDQEAIDPQMGNVLVPLALSNQQIEWLGANGVVASPAEYPEFYVLYKETVQRNLPVFVTSDALLHTYHLIFDQLLSQLEEQVFIEQLRQLNQALLEQAQANYQMLVGTEWEDPARRVYAFLAVGSKLVDPFYQIPGAVSDLAQTELDLIENAGGPAPSPIFPHLKYGEDYSQYVPRGHYTKSEALKMYFRAMMWYGRMTFRLSDPEDAEAGPAETRMALLLALAVRNGQAGSQPALDLWKVLYDPTAFLIGRSDDLTIEDYFTVMDQVYGPQADLTAVADDGKLQEFIDAANKLPAPRILGLLSDDYKPMEAVKGLRLMGQRFVTDAYIFQKLIHPSVPQRWLPSGLDVMAVMGSERAQTWLAQDPTTQIPEYAPRFNQLQDWMGGLTQDEWVETSYNAWLYALRPLLETPGNGYPQFMQSTAWQDKQLNTALGSWSELKHDTLLYAKQPYGGIGAGGIPTPPAPLKPQNYVEPVPEVFARIAAMADMTRQGLEDRGLIQQIKIEETFLPTVNDYLKSISSWSLKLKAMAESELQGKPLTEEQDNSLRAFGDFLEEIVQWANGEKPEVDPAAIIADVATDPNKGEILEVGIGNIHEIYVVAPIPQPDGSLALTVARGGVFSYYEFPSQKRLTDETWRAMLKTGQAPDQPAFTNGFSVLDPARLDIQTVIYRFQRDWTFWLYLTDGYIDTGGNIFEPKFQAPVSENVLRQAQTAVADLVAKNQYEGRQWINTDYLSIEPSTSIPGNVIVTVRETWKDYLVDYTGGAAFTWYDDGTPEPITARRGPYTVDVVYELSPWQGACQSSYPNLCYQWQIARFEELTPRPEWQAP